MRFQRISIVIITLTIAACSTPLTHHETVEGTKPELDQHALENWHRLSGTWYGFQQQIDGSKFEWIVIRALDGKYQFISRTYRDNESHDMWVEFGEWGLAESIYFVITKSWVENGEIVHADMTDPYGRSAYEVISLTDSEFHYRAYSDGSEFKMIRVEDGFKFPDPALF